jgi:hypothetical protein
MLSSVPRRKSVGRLLYGLIAHTLFAGDTFSGIVIILSRGCSARFFAYLLTHRRRQQFADRSMPCRIFLSMRPAIRIPCPGSRAVRMLFSCTESRADNFCLVLLDEMNLSCKLHTRFCAFFQTKINTLTPAFMPANFGKFFKLQMHAGDF